MDWTEVLAAEEENPRSRLVTEIMASSAYGHCGAGRGVRGARGRMPGDLLQLPSDVDKNQHPVAQCQMLLDP